MENNQSTEKIESSISLQDVFYMIKKHVLFIILALVICLGATFTYDKITKKTFSATGTMLASPEDRGGDNSNNTSTYSYMQVISGTFSDLIKEASIAKKVTEKINNQYADITATYGSDAGEIFKNFTSKQYLKGIKTSNENLIIHISYSSKFDDENEAVLCERVVNAAMESIEELSNETYTVTNSEGVIETRKKYRLLDGNLSQLSEAMGHVYESKTVKRLAIGVAIALVLSFAYIAFFEIFNSHFKDSEEIERLLGYPVLAGIPHYDFDESEGKK